MEDLPAARSPARLPSPQGFSEQLAQRTDDHRNRTRTIDQRIQRCNLDISLGFPFFTISLKHLAVLCPIATQRFHFCFQYIGTGFCCGNSGPGLDLNMRPKTVRDP